MKSKVDIEIIKRVKLMREKLDLSQRTLAEIIGTSHSFPSQVEDEKTPCKYSATHLYVIAKYFECEVSDLYPPIDRLEP